MMIAILVGALGTVPKGLEKSEETGDQRKNPDHPNYSTWKISSIT